MPDETARVLNRQLETPVSGAVSILTARPILVRIGIMAVLGSCAIFAGQRFLTQWSTGMLTPWWGNLAGALSMAFLWFWYHKDQERRGPVAVHVTAAVALLALLLPLVYGMTSTVWWLSLVGFSTVLMGRRHEALVWSTMVLGSVIATTLFSGDLQVSGAAGETHLESKMSQIVFAVVLLGIAYGFRNAIERRTYEMLEAKARAQRLALHAKHSPLGFIEWDLDSTVSDWNPAAERIFGYSHAEALGRHARELIPHDDVKGKVAPFWGALTSESWVVRSTTQKGTRSGEIRVCDWYNTPLTDPNGAILGVASLVHDVTEKQRAEKQIEQQAAFLTSVIDSMASPFLVVDVSSYRIILANRAAREFAPPDATTCHRLSHGEDEPCSSSTCPCPLKMIVDSRKPVVVRHTHTRAGGVKRIVDVHAYPIFDSAGEVTQMIEYSVDVTEHDRTQRELRRSEDRFRDLVENTSDWIWEVDSEGRYTYISPRVADLLGYSPDELLGKTPFDLMSPEEADRVGEQFAAIVEAKRAFTNLVNRNKHKNGTTVTLETSGVPVLDEDGYLVGYRGIDRDITEREMAQESLRESEERLRVLFDGTCDLISLVDEDGAPILVNPAWIQVFGEDLEAGPNPFELVHPEDVDAVERGWKDLVTHENPLKCVTCRFQTDKENYRTFETSAFPVRLGGRRLYYVVARDISEQIRLEDQLRAAQRMEAIGRLAGGVAHDFNNILAVISSNGGFAMDALNGDDPVREDIQEILDAANSAASLTRQLLALSRKQVIQPSVLDVNDIICELRKMLQRVIGEDIELHTVLCDGVGFIKADRSQIEQVLMNLSVNARDAMSIGGKLMIETANAELDGAYFADKGVKNMPNGSYVVLSVTDTGVGIDKTVIGYIFDPFFTTKKTGEGTGLERRIG